METRQTIKSFHVVSRKKKTGVAKPVYTTVLTVKVTEFIGFWYPHPTNFDGSVSLQRQPSLFSYYEQEFTEKFALENRYIKP